jgi:tetratricopeptide (TPR) repeat protein
MPAVFAGRRIATLTREGLNPVAVSILLKVESREARDDRSEYEALLSRATELEPRLTAAQLRLALFYTERNDSAKAIDRYRRIVATEPQNAIALNNLAYALAEYQHAPKEALPFAQRAYRASPIPIVLDTLGWVHHLLGDDATALPFIDRAVPNGGDNVDILLHAAVIHAATGDTERAGKELDAAEKLNRSIADRAEIKELRRQLATPPTSR